MAGSNSFFINSFDLTDADGFIRYETHPIFKQVKNPQERKSTILQRQFHKQIQEGGNDSLRKKRMQLMLRIVRTLMFTMFYFCWQAPFSAFAEDSERHLYNNYIYYTISSSGEAIIQNARASITEAIIPEEIEGHPVTEIEGYAFKDCTRLTRVTLPENLHKIGEFAFQNCIRLTELEIPDTVSDIGWGIVQGTPWLDLQKTDFVTAGTGILLAYRGSDPVVRVPNEVRSIGGFAFSSCNTVETVILPDTLTEIEAFAFDQCTNLRQINLPEQLTKIGEYAFHWCTALEEIFLPDSVQIVGNHAFSYCKSLRSARLSASMQQVSNMTFSCCSSLREITIPEGIEVISSYAFQNCTALQTITLPASLTEINNGVFDGCTQLQQVSILNAACLICDEASTFSSANIHGMLFSTANTYAEKYQHTFFALDYIRGDFDENQKISIFDAYLVLMQYALRSAGRPTELTKAQWYTADYNVDGVINIQDAYLILLHYANDAAGNNP